MLACVLSETRSIAVAGKSKCIWPRLDASNFKWNVIGCLSVLLFHFIVPYCPCPSLHLDLALAQTSLACQGLARQILLGVESQFRSQKHLLKQF